MDKNNAQTGFGTLEEEIAFLEQLLVVEEYIGHELFTDRGVSPKDMEVVNMLSSLINGGANICEGYECRFCMRLDEELKHSMKCEADAPQTFSQVGYAQVELFGTVISMPIIRTYNNLRFKNPEKMIKLADVLDIGDTFDVEYTADSETHFVDCMIPEEAIKSLVNEGKLPSAY